MMAWQPSGASASRYALVAGPRTTSCITLSGAAESLAETVASGPKRKPHVARGDSIHTFG